MNRNESKQQKQKWRELWLWMAVVAATGICLLAVLAWRYWPAHAALRDYAPREGDIIFQSLPRSPFVNAIEGATKSPFSHCGIVARRDDAWVVYEAYHGVETTPLRQFVFRGREHGFAVYRLKDPYQQHASLTVSKARGYLGRPYDVRMRMDDERIYCSELIYKAYRDAAGEELGTLVRLGELDWRPFEATIRRFEGGPAPLQRSLITPRRLAAADQLQLIASFNIAAD